MWFAVGNNGSPSQQTVESPSQTLVGINIGDMYHEHNFPGILRHTHRWAQTTTFSVLLSADHRWRWVAHCRSCRSAAQARRMSSPRRQCPCLTRSSQTDIWMVHSLDPDLSGGLQCWWWCRPWTSITFEASKVFKFISYVTEVPVYCMVWVFSEVLVRTRPTCASGTL